MPFLATRLIRRSGYISLPSDYSSDIDPPPKVQQSRKPASNTSEESPTKSSKSILTIPSQIQNIRPKIPSNKLSVFLYGTPMARRKPLKKFEPFPQLPTELRLKIWKLALPRGCKLEVFGYPCDSLGLGMVFEHVSLERYPSTQAQKDLHWDRALLRACTESREVYHKELPYILNFIRNVRQSESKWRRPKSPTYTQQFWHEFRFGDDDVIEIKNLAMMLTWPRKLYWRALVRQDWVPKIKTLSLPPDVNLVQAAMLEKIMACFESLQRIQVGSVVWEKRLPVEGEWGQKGVVKNA
ncbi:hypothetical protein BDZ45DRAFT_747849 [Acephala macrosclerotiorum]|nr:hypothetical protein BDZ45DRAFT_747849 [Acephala macrosclerotiorum]